MGRARIHADNAARQAAYRARLKAAGLGSFEAAPGDGSLADVPRATSAMRAMHQRVAATVRRIDPSIDTTAVDGGS